MEFSFQTQVQANKEKVWEYYADIQKWYLWEKDLKNITLDHAFATGSSGVMELQAMPPMEYLLTLVKENQEFWNKSDTPFGSIYFGHEIFVLDANKVTIKHTVKLESEPISIDKVNILKQIFANVPNAVINLKECVENNA